MAGEMTFWEHLDELRKIIFRSFAVLIVLMVAFFLCKEIVFDGVVLAPLTDDFFVYRWLNSLLALMGLPALKPFAVPCLFCCTRSGYSCGLPSMTGRRRRRRRLSPWPPCFST